MTGSALRVGLVGSAGRTPSIAERLVALGGPLVRIDVDTASSTSLSDARDAFAGLARRSDVIVSALDDDRLAVELLGLQADGESSCVIVEASAITPRTLARIAASARSNVYGAAFGRRLTGERIATVLYIDAKALALPQVASVARALADDIVCVADGTRAKALAIVEGLLAGVNDAIVSEALALAEAAGVDRSDIVRLLHKGSGATAMMSIRDRLSAVASDEVAALDPAMALRDGLSRALSTAQSLQHPLLFGSVAMGALRSSTHDRARRAHQPTTRVARTPARAGST